jgi:glycerophosphoryl diester phosphodiesterase
MRLSVYRPLVVGVLLFLAPWPAAQAAMPGWSFLLDSSVAQLGERPRALVADMDPGPLKDQLQACEGRPMQWAEFSIGHRGAPLRFPEHTLESYTAAARMGAGIVECDVTFTKDRELVCRHAQDDLHTTTNVVTIPELNAKCTQPFVPAVPSEGTPAQAECRASDFTLAEFKSLQGKTDDVNPMATTPDAYIDAGPRPLARGTLLSHRESIRLLKALGVGFAPELKTPVVAMPYEGDYTQEDFARQMIAEYRAEGVPPEAVWPQSFRLADILFWLDQANEFGQRAALLDMDKPTPLNTSMLAMAELKALGVNALAAPLWKLLALDDQGHIVPSRYARNARMAGLALIAWTVERSGSLAGGGGWYYQSVAQAIDNDGDMVAVIDVLAREVGVIGIFSDWPATTTFYANCTGLAGPSRRPFLNIE